MNPLSVPDIAMEVELQDLEDKLDVNNMCVYALVDPECHQIKYIGISSRIKARLRNHLNGQSHNGDVRCWVKRLKENNKRPRMYILERTSPENITTRESYWIKHYGVDNLLNKNPGGFNKIIFEGGNNSMHKDEIKAIREKLGLTQEAFAREVGVTVTTISRWESGRVAPHQLAVDKIKELAK